jgi:hypothetical protein
LNFDDDLLRVLNCGRVYPPDSFISFWIISLYNQDLSQLPPLGLGLQAVIFQELDGFFLAFLKDIWKKAMHYQFSGL